MRIKNNPFYLLNIDGTATFDQTKSVVTVVLAIKVQRQEKLRHLAITCLEQASRYVEAM
jgi:hypothetical protein